MGRTGCGVPRVALHVIPGRLRKPALRHYERARQTRDGEAFLLHPARDRANNRRGGAPKGERLRMRRLRKLACVRRKARRKRLRACVIGPRKGAAAPERLSALRSPLFDEGILANLGEQYASRERRCVCIRLAAARPRESGDSAQKQEALDSRCAGMSGGWSRTETTGRVCGTGSLAVPVEAPYPRPTCHGQGATGTA
jgi:hypothetical protein